jgi:hypothetical protein
VKIISEFAFTSALGYVSCCSRLKDKPGCIHVDRSNTSMTGEIRKLLMSAPIDFQAFLGPPSMRFSKWDDQMQAAKRNDQLIPATDLD